MFKRISFLNRVFAGLCVLSCFAMLVPVGAIGQDRREERVSLDFSDTLLEDVLIILEDLTGRSVIRPDGLPPAIFDFRSPRPLSRAERITVIESMLALKGIVIVPEGELFLKVVPASGVAGRTPEFLQGDLSKMVESEAVYARFFKLQHLTTEEVQPLLQPFLSPGTGQIQLFQKANSILITDSLVNLKRVDEILMEVDQPSNPNVIVKFYDVHHGSAAELVSQVESIITAGYEKYLNANSTIKADERTNQIIVVTHPSNLSVIEQFIKELDVDKGARIFNEAISLRHGDALEIAGILNEIVSGQVDTTKGNRSADQNKEGSNTTVPATQAPSVTVRGSAVEGGGEAGLQFSESLIIVADERSNALIVTGTKRDLEQASQLIKKLDVLLPQVRIDVIIAEVRFNDNKSSGLEEFGFNYTGSSIGNSINPFNVGDGISVDALSEAAGGSDSVIFLDDLSMSVVVEKARSKNNIRLINVPTIVTTHNREATIIVGESRPLITGTQSTINSSGEAGTTLRDTVQYKDIGIELTVTPLIGSNGVIQLEIDQIVDNVGENITINNNEQPIITRRQATSFVSVEDGKLITLAGFQESTIRNDAGTLGIIGYIPFFGNLFNPKNKEKKRQELIFFIRPTILRTTADANADAEKTAMEFSGHELISDAVAGERVTIDELGDMVIDENEKPETIIEKIGNLFQEQ